MKAIFNLRSVLSLFLCLFVAIVYGQKSGAYKCLDFDGTNDYVHIQDHASLNSDSTITVEAWIKADNYGRNVYDNSIFCKHGWSRGNLGYVLRCGANGKLSFNFSDGGGTWREVETSAVMKRGVWYHVAGSYDGDSINVYINGKRMATTLYTGSISPSSGLTARIGDLANGGGRLFDGMIDEVRVWSTAIEESTIRDWMCRRMNTSHPNYSNLAGNWSFDEDTSNKANDYSTNNNTGTLNNGPIRSISEAVIGDSSTHVYGGTSIALESKYKDIFQASSIAGNPSCFHVVVDYRRNEQTLDSNLSGQLDSTHYYSVFYPADTSVKFTMSYDFGNKKGISAADKCGIDLFTKTTNATGTWSHAGAVFHQKGDSLTLQNQRQSAFGILSYPTDSNTILSSNTGKFAMCGSNTLKLTAIGNDSFTYLWGQNDSFLYSVTTNTLTVDSPATYYVIVTRKGTTCSFTSKKIRISRISAPTVSLTSFKGVCESVDSLQLKGGSPAGGVYSGTGVVGGYFLPSTVKNGTYNIIYTYADSNNCSSTASQNIQVFGLPNLTSSGNNSFCNDKDSVELDFIQPTGGNYSGTFISNNFFHIDSANRQSKLYPFTYTYSDGNGCTNSLNDSIEIKWATPITLLPVPQLCHLDDSIQLKGSPAKGVYSGIGVSGDYFHPRIAGVGKHEIIYAFTNLLNCTTTDTQQVVVIANGSVSWNQKVTTCINGDSVVLSGGSPSGGYYAGKGVLNNIFDPEIATTGSHSLAYVSTDTNGCENKAWVTATVHDTTIISFQGDTAFCLFTSPIRLNTGIPTGGTYLGSGVSSDTLFPNIAGPGTHVIQYSYSNNKGCESKAEVRYILFTPDSVSITANEKLCSYDDPVVLNTYPSGGQISGEGVIGSVFSPSISGPGNHTITYTISDTRGCSAFDSITIEVGVKPEVSLTPLASKCESDEAFKLINGIPKDVGVYRLNGVETDSINPKQLGQGQFYIEYKVVTAIGCKDSAFTYLVINPSPNKPTITKSKNNLVSSYLNGNQWYDMNGEIEGAINQQYAATKDGLYYTIVTTDSGCSATSDTFNFMYVGIGNTVKPSFRIWPNPSKSGLFNYTSDGPFTHLVITTVNGEILPNTIILNPNNQINLSDYPAGVYFVTLKQRDKITILKLQKL